MSRDQPFSPRQGPGDNFGDDAGKVPEDLSSFVKNTAFDPAERLRKYRPTLGKKVAAWIGVVMGVLMVVGIFTTDTEGFISDVLMGTGLGALMIIPGAYWLMCNHRDSRTITEWVRANREYQVNWEMLAKDERELFSRPEQLPVIPERRWKTVAYLMIAAFIVALVGGTLAPEPLEA